MTRQPACLVLTLSSAPPTQISRDYGNQFGVREQPLPLLLRTSEASPPWVRNRKR